MNRKKFFLGGIAYSLESASGDGIDEDIRAMFINELFFEVEGEWGPCSEISRNFMQAKNQLRSIFYGDHAKQISVVLGSDGFNESWPSFTNRIARRAIKQLEKQPNDERSWLILYHVVGDLPPARGLGAGIKRLLCSVKFSEIMDESLNCCGIAIHFASLQCGHVKGGAAKANLWSEITNIARKRSSLGKLDSLGKDDIQRERLFQLKVLEAVRDFCSEFGDPKKSVQDFAGRTSSLIDLWPSLAETCRPVAQTLWEELPFDHAQFLAPVLLRGRVGRRNANSP